jgi:CHAT domain-containing protein/tetratricopeptide (TPR) repeat protein
MHKLLKPARVARTGFAVSMIVLFAGCQPDAGKPPALSLDQAKQVSVSFENEAFVPPPRSIADIASVLDSQKQANPERKKADEAEADAKPPEDAPLPQMIRFYSERGSAALQVGRTKQAIADLEKANELAQRAFRMPANGKALLLNKLSDARYLGGRPRDAIADLEAAIDMNEAPLRGAAWRSRLAIWQAISGDIEAAEKTIGLAQAAADSAATLTKGRGAEAWKENGLAITAGIRRADARIRMSKGDFSGAEQLLRQSLAYIQEFAKKDAEWDVSQRRRLAEFIRADLGIALLRQGRAVEAEVEIRVALDDALKRVGRYSGAVARFTSNLAAVMAAQGRPEDAEKLARASVEILDVIGSDEGSNFRLLSRSILGRSLAAQRRWGEAIAQFEPFMLPALPEFGLAVRQVGPFYGLGLIFTGDPQRAIRHAGDAIAYLEPRLGRKHQSTAEAIAVLATAQTLTGDDAAARKNFAEAVPVLLSRSRSSDEENEAGSSRARWMDIVLEAYVAVLTRDRGGATASAEGIATAFTVADAARGQRVQAALAASAARSSVPDPVLADLVRREQDAVKRIGALNALYAAAVSVPESQRNAAALSTLRGQIDSLRGARAALAEEIESKFPDYANLLQPKPATFESVRASLRPDEALIATFVGRKASYVWAIPKSGAARFARSRLTEEQFGSAVSELRSAMAPRGTSLESIPRFDVHLANRLYRELLAPVADGWRNARALLVVAHGPLAQMPFSLLVTDDGVEPKDASADGLFSGYRTVPWLVRTHAVTVLPSVGSLATLRSTPPAAAARRAFVGFGDPVFDPAAASVAGGPAVAMRGGAAFRLSLRSTPSAAGASVTLKDLPPLPDTAEEVRSIAAALGADPAQDVFTGKAASEASLRTLGLDRYRIVAFATHGLIPGDLDGLSQPALALSAPAVRTSKEDGLLTMGEILGLKLDADWVVLSACNTASGDGRGAEAVSGLGRAFFYAGTRAILASNWPVESSSARTLTTDVFARQAADRSLGRAEALRRAMVSLIDGGGMKDAGGRVLFTYAHPIFWAPFSLFGEAGGTPGS